MEIAQKSISQDSVQLWSRTNIVLSVCVLPWQADAFRAQSLPQHPSPIVYMRQIPAIRPSYLAQMEPYDQHMTPTSAVLMQDICR